MSYTPSLSFDLSPVRLSYVAALRGVLPRKAGQAFSYAQMGSFDPQSLLCLAASNPEGRFFGILPTALEVEHASIQASERQVWNISFGTATDLLPAELNFLCCDQSSAQPTEAERNELFALAEAKLAPGGALAYRYKAYETTDQILRFLIEAFRTDLSTDKAEAFLSDLETLGTLYFASHPQAKEELEKAKTNHTPETFFTFCLEGNDSNGSGTYNTMAGLLPHQFSGAGDLDIHANYLELAAPESTHEMLASYQDHLFYEPIKDFALGRLVRNDLWVKLPVAQSDNKPELFGFFTYGITSPRTQIPAKVPTNGAEIDLTTPLFSSLIDLMCLLPMSIGDFLKHPSCLGFSPDDVVAATQILVALGIAQPMRGRYQGHALATTPFPTWANGYNAHFKRAPINESKIYLASPVVGSAVMLSAREALVLQALSRVGLANISGALQMTLKQLIIDNPSLAVQVVETTDLTDEVIHTLVTNVLETGMVRWYAYGLLAA